MLTTNLFDSLVTITDLGKMVISFVLGKSSVHLNVVVEHRDRRSEE